MSVDPSYTPDPALVAQRFHEAYERLAPSFGYETRRESAKPWAEVPEHNKALMTAVCAEVLSALATEGRLLPPDAEVRTEWAWDCARGGCWHGDEVKLPHLHEGDEKWVREVAPDIWPGGRPMRRASSPWLPVPTEGKG